MAFHSTFKDRADEGHLNKSVGTSNYLDTPVRDRAAKAFSTLRATFAFYGLCLYRTDPADGPVTYWTESGGVIHMLPTIEAVQALLAPADSAS